MKFEIYRTLMKINIPVEDAKAVADSINNEIDKRYNLYVQHLITKSDLSEPKVEIIKWTVGSMFVAVGLFAGIAYSG